MNPYTTHINLCISVVTEDHGCPRVPSAEPTFCHLYSDFVGHGTANFLKTRCSLVGHRAPRLLGNGEKPGRGLSVLRY